MSRASVLAFFTPKDGQNDDSKEQGGIFVCPDNPCLEVWPSLPCVEVGRVGAEVWAGG